MKNGTQAPNLTHANAARICEMALQAMELRAERTADYRDGYDFKVEDRVRIAVRYAIPTSDRQQEYRKRNGEVSHYSYKRWTFNFHRHGKRPERYCDFFVCLLAHTPHGEEDLSDVSVFTIPWDAITGLTFCSSLRDGSSRAYRGKYAVYKDGWHLIEHASHGRRRLPSERKRLQISSDARRQLQLIVQSDAAAASEGMEPMPIDPAVVAQSPVLSQFRGLVD